MASGRSSAFKQFLHRHCAFLFSVCPGYNYHWRWHRHCVCIAGENGAKCAIKRNGKWLVIMQRARS